MEQAAAFTERPVYISVRKIIALFTLASFVVMIFTISYVTKHRPGTDQRKTRQALAQHIKW